MEPIGELTSTTQQADAICDRLGEVITRAVTETDVTEINVLKFAQSAGLEIDADLDRGVVGGGQHVKGYCRLASDGPRASGDGAVDDEFAKDDRGASTLPSRSRSSVVMDWAVGAVTSGWRATNWPISTAADPAVATLLPVAAGLAWTTSAPRT